MQVTVAETPTTVIAGRGWAAAGLLSALALVGVLAVLYATPSGIGLSPDSRHYLGYAQQIIDGGEGPPMTHYPPLYSWVLGGIGLLGPAPAAAARWLGALLFAGNILLVGGIVYRLSGGSLWATALAALLVLCARHLLHVHAMAWSEPLFIFCGTAGLFLLAMHLDRPAAWMLVATAVAMALAFLTRYVGVVLVGTGMLALLFLHQAPLRRRVWESALFGAIGVLPMALVLLRNRFVAGTATNREVHFFLIGREQLEQLFKTVVEWLLPRGTSPWLALILLMLVAGGLAILCFRGRGRERRGGDPDSAEAPLATRLIPVLVLFMGLYVLFLVLSITFIDALTPLDFRIMAPALVTAILAAVLIVHRALQPPRGSVVLRAVVLPAVLFVVANGAYYSVREVVALHRQDGAGYASRPWRTSPTIEYIRALPPDVRIYSNGPDAVRQVADRQAVMIPPKQDPGSRRPNPNYEPEMESMRRVLSQYEGVIVFFRRSPPSRRQYLPTEQELNEALPLVMIEELGDGVIYRLGD